MESCGCCRRRRGRGGQLAQRSEEDSVLWFGSRDMKGWLVSSFPSRFITRQQDFHRSSRQQDRFFRQTGSSKGSSSQHKQILTAGQALSAASIPTSVQSLQPLGHPRIPLQCPEQTKGLPWSRQGLGMLAELGFPILASAVP